MLRESIRIFPLFLVMVVGCAVGPHETELKAQQHGEQAHHGVVVTNPSAPINPETMFHILVGEVAGQRGELTVSLDHYLEAARLSNDPGVAERATRIAVFTRNDAKALEAAERWVMLAPDNLEARQALAALYIREGQIDTALKQLEKLLASATGGSDEGFRLVTALLGEEKERRVALSIMEHLVENYRDNPHAQFALARVAAHAGEPARAKRAVRQALRIRPDWVEAHLLLARLLMQQGDTNQALQTLEKVLSAHPENKDLRLNYAQILVEARRLDEAHREFERLVGQAPNDADMLYVVGILSLQGARLDDAEHYLKRLVETGQRQLEGYYYLGRIEESRNHSSAAIKWYSKVRHGEFRIDARTRIAALLAKGGDIAAGRALLQKLRADHPNLAVRLYVAEGEILSESGRGEDAFELYTGALQKLPGDADLLYARALVAEKLNRLDVLEQDLSDILEYDPDNAHALNALGYTLANRTTRYQEALQYIQRALELNPNDHAVIDSMGWVQYRLRNYEEAVKYLRRALSMSQDPEVAAHLGEVLWVKGDQPAAREVWERALQTDPSSEAVLEVMKRFQE